MARSRRRFPWLHHDAPAVPEELRPREPHGAMYYGCGEYGCRMCYEVDPDQPGWMHDGGGI